MSAVKLKGTTLKLGVVVASLICVMLFTFSTLGIHDVWPASLLLLFFFEGGAKGEKIKSIFSGATVGLLAALGLFHGVELLAPLLGLQASIYSLVFLAIFFLIVLGDLSHTLFNNYAFCYFTVALIFPEQSTLKWLFALYAGGAFLLVGVTYFIRMIHRTKRLGEESVSVR
ncbi:hypothetical protein [Acidaminobacter sp.]|uniref:hypothetical protein n=1 Tax=Acidaminobacter sp. TaxID=1872102 RepID=UPI0025629AD4|nr:hypothetical protein [Acidaminobacter sp.]MDK9712343.1 hypothetical protein [Acidaminobacter sp.]